jgi:uncharacterized protein (DUF697 family)
MEQKNVKGKGDTQAAAKQAPPQGSGSEFEKKLEALTEAAVEKEKNLKKNDPPAIVKKYMWWSMGAGAIPIPLVDNGALILVQLKMVKRLAEHYGIKISDHDGRALITTLLGTVAVNSLTYGGFTSFVKSIPLVGIVGLAAMPVYSGAITYAIGTLFTLHFSSKGDLLDFDLKTANKYFGRLFLIGKEEAKKISAD